MKGKQKSAENRGVDPKAHLSDGRGGNARTGKDTQSCAESHKAGRANLGGRAMRSRPVSGGKSRG